VSDKLHFHFKISWGYLAVMINHYRWRQHRKGVAVENEVIESGRAAINKPAGEGDPMGGYPQ